MNRSDSIASCAENGIAPPVARRIRAGAAGCRLRSPSSSTHDEVDSTDAVDLDLLTETETEVAEGSVERSIHFRSPIATPPCRSKVGTSAVIGPRIACTRCSSIKVRFQRRFEHYEGGFAPDATCRALDRLGDGLCCSWDAGRPVDDRAVGMLSEPRSAVGRRAKADRMGGDCDVEAIVGARRPDSESREPR